MRLLNNAHTERLHFIYMPSGMLTPGDSQLSQRITGTGASVISSFLLIPAISAADLVAISDRQCTCISPNLSHLLLSCPSASPGQCLLPGDKRGEDCFIIHQHAPDPSALLNLPCPPTWCLTSPCRDRALGLHPKW